MKKRKKSVAESCVAKKAAKSSAVSTPKLRKRKGRPKGSTKQVRPQIANLFPFRDVGTQTDMQFFNSVDASTDMPHSRHRPPAGRYTGGDQMSDRAHAAYQKLTSCMQSGFHWTTPMILILLQFFFFLIWQEQHSFTQATFLAATYFKINNRSVSKLANLYLKKVSNANTTNFWPGELPQRKRGWGADSFQAKKDNYCLIKEEHLKAVTDYVTERNTSMKGMCNVRSIIAHLYQKFGISFKYRTVHYALTERLHLKYRTPLQSRLIFSEGRTKLGIGFVTDLDQAIKDERAGRCVIVYMDESYCHTNHMPSKCWCGDNVGRVERSRSKGTLTIILHAMTKDGWLFCEDSDGNRPDPEEQQDGVVFNTQMVWRGKHGKGDYHDNMDGHMFEKWLTERLVPTFKKRYPGKRMVLCMDNAPYHHVHPDDSFFASGKTKEEMRAKLEELNVESVTVTPFPEGARWVDPPADPDTQPAADFEGGVFFERTTGLCWLVDGMSDEGFGDVIVYTKIGKKKFGAVESSLVDDFRRLLRADFDWIGYGTHAVRFVRQDGFLNRNGRVKKTQRRRGAQIRRQCRQFFATTAATTFEYRVCDISNKYNGAGQRGTGGPKTEWLRAAVDRYIIANHPELRLTKVMKLFASLGWSIIFTVPYWAKSQPIELAWAYVKGYCGRMYHPGRSAKDLRQHILQGMYGNPAKRHAGLDAALAQKLILKTHKFINEFAQQQPELNGRGLVGDFTPVGAAPPLITVPLIMGANMGPIDM